MLFGTAVRCSIHITAMDKSKTPMIMGLASQVVHTCTAKSKPAKETSNRGQTLTRGGWTVIFGSKILVEDIPKSEIDTGFE